MNGIPEQKPKGIGRLREAGRVAVRLRFTGGAATADHLAAMADLLETYRGAGRKGERLGETFARVGWPEAAAVTGRPGKRSRT
jgi:dissimilatory sulfite reductase (desulfoviridin) alpha/beta subunit